jgi:S-adenosylmethionine:tRNA ribosyltransferase-isomerase
VLDEYDYALPPQAIAQEPVEPRSAARLLVATDPAGSVAHGTVAGLPELLAPGDVVVVNDTKVIPARLRLRKATGGAVEVLLLDPAGAGAWEALVKPSRRVPPGTVLYAGDEPVVEAGAYLDGGRRQVVLCQTDERVLARHGAVALPPYIHRDLADPARYQTVYANHPGSVAAPTAGLHLTEEVLAAIRARGIPVVGVDLTVGLDTFRPITASNLDDHVMHSERYAVPDETVAACADADRVVAIGTTTVRALESAAAGPGAAVTEGRTTLFIRPGYTFRAVDVLLTNFHMPKSSLLVLLAAFAGDRWRALYDTALASGYRFLSFGDAMLVARRPNLRQ